MNRKLETVPKPNPKNPKPKNPKSETETRKPAPLVAASLTAGRLACTHSEWGGWVQGTELGAAADGMCVTWVVGTEIWPPADTPPLLKVQTTRPPSALCFVTVLLLDGSPVSAPRVLSKKHSHRWVQ